MSYLEEWDRIEQMIENHNTSKSTVITSEKRQALALSHIAKCLSVLADSQHDNVCQIISDNKKIEKTTDNICCETCLHGDKDIHQDPCLSCDGYGGYWEKATDAKPCNNCIHSNEEYELNCSVCDENHSEYKPFGFRGKVACSKKHNEIEVRCPSCGEIITAIKLKEDILNLKCPTCGADFTYNISTNVREWRI